MSNTSSTSASRALTRRVPTASPNDTVSNLLTKIKAQAPSLDTVSYVYILTTSEKLKGVVAIKSILKATDTQKMKDIMTPNPISVHPHTDQERAAILAIQHNIKAVPVTDQDGKFLGIIPTDRILGILQEEHIEDILKLSGLDVSTLKLSDKSQKRTWSSLRMRFPWLVLGLVGGLVSIWVVSRFEHTIQELLALAFFIPIIPYTSGAIANQTMSMLIRNLLLVNLDIKKYILRELATGTLLGSLFGMILAGISYLWLGSKEVALIVGLSMAVNAALATLVAALVPWILSSMKKDPALAAGPFAIVLQDILSLLVYFSIAASVLNTT